MLNKTKRKEDLFVNRPAALSDNPLKNRGSTNEEDKAEIWLF